MSLSLIVLDADKANPGAAGVAVAAVLTSGEPADGQQVAYVEGWASDRGLLAGEVQLARLDSAGAGTPPPAPTRLPIPPPLSLSTPPSSPAWT